MPEQASTWLKEIKLSVNLQWWKGYTRFRMLRRLSKGNVMLSEIEEEVVVCSVSPRIVHDKYINDYQAARSRRADDEIVSRL
jgi:hypothetical protein